MLVTLTIFWGDLVQTRRWYEPLSEMDCQHVVTKMEAIPTPERSVTELGIYKVGACWVEGPRLGKRLVESLGQSRTISIPGRK